MTAPVSKCTAVAGALASGTRWTSPRASLCYTGHAPCHLSAHTLGSAGPSPDRAQAATSAVASPAQGSIPAVASTPAAVASAAAATPPLAAATAPSTTATPPVPAATPPVPTVTAPTPTVTTSFSTAAPPSPAQTPTTTASPVWTLTVAPSAPAPSSAKTLS